MTYKHFQLILKSWHWENTAAIPEGPARTAKNKENPFWATETFVDRLSNNFSKCYHVGRFVDVDEQCFAFKGRHRCRQFNASKPSKFHFKAFGLNDAETGYQHSMFMYKGNDPMIAHFEVLLGRKISATEYPVIRLMWDDYFHDRGVILCLDNWYMSPILMGTFMLPRGIHGVGTTKAMTRGLPTNFIIPKTGKIPRGTFSTASAVVPGGTLYFTSWQDSKPVHILSTFPTSIVEVNRNAKDKKTGAYAPQQLKQPTVVKTYNYGMGGSDKMDQMISYYKTRVRSRNWQHRIMTHFLGVAAVNAHILYCTKFPDPADEHHHLKEFLLGLVRDWATPAASDPDLGTAASGTMRTAARTQASVPDSVRLHGSHTPRHLKQTSLDEEGNRVDTRRRCAFCGKSKCIMECTKCNVGLCIPEKFYKDSISDLSCWEMWHAPIGAYDECSDSDSDVSEPAVSDDESESDDES